MAKVALPPNNNDGRAPDRRNIWFSAPQLWTVIGGLVTAAIGSAITGYLSFRLEKQKFESQLIEKAFEAKDDNEKANGLAFLANAGLIPDYNEGVLGTLPTFLGAAIRDRIIKVVDVKNVLSHIGIHPGPINDEADDTFRRAIVEFQVSRHLAPDGYIGKDTYAKLREAWPEHFIRDFLTVREAKTILADLRMHIGPINDEADEGFRKEIVDFQISSHIEPDGYIGNPLTSTKLKEAWANHKAK